MDVYKGAEKVMGMDAEAWARHTNPLSVYSRMTCLPLIALAIWSRVWFGWWALIPLAAALTWTWLNPRLFSAPKSLDNWASKGVLGEQIFLDRANRNIADHHVRMAKILTGVSVVGMVILAWGLWVLHGWAVILGLLVTIVPKLWFVDRMVWILQDDLARRGK